MHISASKKIIAAITLVLLSSSLEALTIKNDALRHATFVFTRENTKKREVASLAHNRSVETEFEKKVAGKDKELMYVTIYKGAPGVDNKVPTQDFVADKKIKGGKTFGLPEDADYLLRMERVGEKNVLALYGAPQERQRSKTMIRYFAIINAGKKKGRTIYEFDKEPKVVLAKPEEDDEPEEEEKKEEAKTAKS